MIAPERDGFEDRDALFEPGRELGLRRGLFDDRDEVVDAALVPPEGRELSYTVIASSSSSRSIPRVEMGNECRDHIVVDRDEVLLRG